MNSKLSLGTSSLDLWNITLHVRMVLTVGVLIRYIHAVDIILKVHSLASVVLLLRDTVSLMHIPPNP